MKTSRQWRMALTLVDVLMIVATLCLAVLLLSVAIVNGEKPRKPRNRRDMLHCRNMLHQIGVAMYMYADMNGGFYPHHSPSAGRDEPGGHRSTDSLALLYPDIIPDLGAFRCPLTEDQPQIVIWKERGVGGKPVVRSKRFGKVKGSTFVRSRREQSSYGYDDRIGLRNVHPQMPVAADMDGSSVANEGRQTANHDGGQNVLFYDTHVDWKSVNVWVNVDRSDNFVVNEFGGGDTDSWISRDEDSYIGTNAP